MLYNTYKSFVNTTEYPNNVEFTVKFKFAKGDTFAPYVCWHRITIIAIDKNIILLKEHGNL